VDFVVPKLYAQSIRGQSPTRSKAMADTPAGQARAITGIPHSILVDPNGIVRYKGMPGYLDDPKLEHFFDKYK
jgi:hypothetical protein